MLDAYDPVEVADYYAHLFPARNDVYSAWIKGSAGWRPVRNPLTAKVVLAGLRGTGPSISGYMITPENTSHSFALDFDAEDGLEQAYTLAAFMQAYQMPVYIETSRRGAHMWGTLEEPLPAKTIRNALRAMLQKCNLKDPHIELRPGSNTIEPDGLGHAIRLPLMPHPKTGQRGKFFYPDRSPVADRISHIMMAMKTVQVDPASPFIKFSADYWPTIVRVPRAFGPPRPRSDDEFEDASASEILSSLWGVPNARPGIAVRCPAHPDKSPSLHIYRHDERVLCYSPECILNNGGHGRGTYELTKLAGSV